MTRFVKQHRLEVGQIVCYLGCIVCFFLAEFYLLSVVFALVLLVKIIELYGKVKKSKEYDKD